MGMEKNIPVLEGCQLFADIERQCLMHLMSCLGAAEKRYEKQEYIFLAGEALRSVGIVLSGGVHIVQEDFWGNRTILTRIAPGGLFGDSFEIPYNRQELAEYLSVDRSALSAELSKMRREGCVDYRKNHFTLIHK